MSSCNHSSVPSRLRAQHRNIITTRWRLCVTMETLWHQPNGGYALLDFYIFNSTVVDWTCCFFFPLLYKMFTSCIQEILQLQNKQILKCMINSIGLISSRKKFSALYWTWISFTCSPESATDSLLIHIYWIHIHLLFCIKCFFFKSYTASQGACSR